MDRKAQSLDSLWVRTYSKEPFCTFFIENLKLEPLGFGMLAFLLSFVVPLILCLINHTAYPWANDGLESYLESPTTYLFRLWMIPLAAILMLLFYQRTSHVLKGLKLSKAIECDEQTFRRLISGLEKTVGSPLVLVISLIFTGLALWDIIAKGGSPGTLMVNRSWTDLWSAAGIYNVFVLDAGMFYFSAQILVRAAVFLFWLNKLFKDPDVHVNLSIKNPDGEAGLAALKEIKRVIYPFVFLVGMGGPIDLAMGMSSFTHLLPLVLVVSFIVLGSLAFFAPLLPAKEHLMRAWGEYQRSIQHIMSGEQARQLKEIECYSDVQRFSSHWGVKVRSPYNLSTLVLFFLVVGTPVLLMIFIEILKHIK